MRSVRATLPAIVIIAAVVSTMGLPIFANQLHPVCVAMQHECSQTTTIAACCCGDDGDASHQSGPVESKTELNPSLTFVTAALATPLDPLHRTIARPHTSPPRADLLDLSTLFATLLI